MAKVVGTVGGSKAQPSECLKRAYTGNEPAERVNDFETAQCGI